MKAIIGFIVVLFSGLYQAAYLSPEYMAVAPDGKTLYVTMATSNELLLYDTNNGKAIGRWTLPCDPSGVTVAADGTVYVTGGNAEGALYELDATGKILAKVETGHTPLSPVVARDGKTVYVLNRFDNSVVAIDVASREVRATVPVLREPFAAALGAGGHLLFVANHLPACPANGNMAAAVSVIDMSNFKLLKHVMLPNGSTGVRGIAADSDGRFIYVTHMLGRYQLPTMQLERGWMSTAGLSIFNGETGEYVNTVLLDDVYLGAANSWGVAVSSDGKHLIVAHAGTREISVIDREALHAQLGKAAKGERVTDVTNSAADVPNDLSFLANIRRRVELDGEGPRGVTVVGDRVFATLYFSDALAEVRMDDATLKSVAIPLGPTVDLSRDAVRRGEMLFNDAIRCFQHWLSCASCHPDARMDGLNWDLLNDGVGNPKSVKSMLLSHQTPPAMGHGIRSTAEVAVRSGFKYILFSTAPEDDAVAVDGYLKSMHPVPSPYLVNGKLSKLAKKGQKIFEQAGCNNCHSGSYYTNMKSYDVGTLRRWDKRKEKPLLDVPSLIEVWRTAPYLHDGRTMSVEEAFRSCSQEGVSGLSPEEIKALQAFVLSL